MQRFGLVFRHYLKRTFMHKGNLLAMLLLPITIILLFAFVNDNWASEEGYNQLFYGYNVLHTSLVISNLFFFQLFGAFNNIDNLHEAMGNDTKWRLFAAPVNRTVFTVGGMLASWVVSILQGLIILAVTGIVLNVYWGNPLVNILTLLGLSLFAQVLGVLIFLITKNAAQGNAIAYPFIFFIGGLNGFIIPIRELMNHSIIDFLANWSPLNLAMQAVTEGGRFGSLNLIDGVYPGGDMSIAIRNIVILYAMVVVIGVISYTLGKVKRVW